MSKDYEELLDRAYEKIPETRSEKKRFEVPEAEVDISGNQTTLKNLRSIANDLGRDPDHLMKYLLNELGTAGNREDSTAKFQGKFDKGEVQERIDDYTQKFVLCSECGRPDTKLEKESGVTMLRCEACGARSSTKG